MAESEVDNEDIDWKERCQMLEASLGKFKQRAGHIRELLAQKMDILTKQAEDSEVRAQAAERKCEELEGELVAARLPRSSEDRKKLQLLENQCQEKDKKVGVLEATIHELRQMRIQDQKAIEEKCVKIKDWVSKKMREMEQENEECKKESDDLRYQLEVLRARLNSLPSTDAKELHRMSFKDFVGEVQTETSSSAAPDIPKRPAASIMESIRQERQIEQLQMVARKLQHNHYQNDEVVATSDVDEPAHTAHVVNQTLQLDASFSVDSDDDNIEDADQNITDEFEPLYQEIDDNHQSKYRPMQQKNNHGFLFSQPGSAALLSSGANSNSPALSRTGPPQVHIQRKVFANAMTSSIASSLGGSEEEQRNSFAIHPSSDLSESMISSVSFDPCDSSASGVQKLPPGTLSQPYAPPNSPTPSVMSAAVMQNSQSSASTHVPSVPNQGSYNTFSAIATMPRRKKDNLVQDLKPRTQESRLPGTKDDSSTIPYEHLHASAGPLARTLGARMKPPTPPMRRVHSVERHIYAVASAGMKLPDPGMGRRKSNLPVTEGLYSNQMYKTIAAPVFTVLKGKAAQIRSQPFEGDTSTDSSSTDDEDATATTFVSPSDTAEGVTMSVAGPSESKSSFSTSSAMSRSQPQVNHTSSGALKRGVSSHSIGSETSSDYAEPPDEISIQGDSSDSCEPDKKLLKVTSDSITRGSSEKCGYLKKLGGRGKSWKKHWFVLRRGEILYYKSPSDVTRKPQNIISLDTNTRITKSEEQNTFEIANLKRTYYLATETKEEMDQWLRVLQNILKKQASEHALHQNRSREAKSGWLIKTKHGRRRTCWCVILGKYFMYYKRPSDKTPLGQEYLADSKIIEVDRSCDSETDSDDTTVPDYTIAILPQHQDPTYLMISDLPEKESWLYHLTVASGGGIANVGTEFEQIIAKLMSSNGEPGNVLWKHPLLLHSKEALLKPLTTLSSAELQNKALTMFKTCQMFTNMAIDSSQIDFHVQLAQTIMELCKTHPDLQNELYCQLIRQTSRHPYHHKSGVPNFLLCGSQALFQCDGSPTSPTNSILDNSGDKINPSQNVFIQTWQLMSMCIAIFQPKQTVLWFLRAHLHRHADPRSEIGKYAVFCQRALERAINCGLREARPSRMEVMSILLRNPYHHSQPISIPVHLPNDTYQVVSFDGSTKVGEFLNTLNRMLGLRDCKISGFSLFTDDPTGQELEHCLKDHLNLCDVISKWETAFYNHHSKMGRLDTNRTVRLVYKNRLYYKSLMRTETDKERLLLVYQVNEEIVNGRFPLNRDLALELAALLAQIEHGDYRSPNDSMAISLSGRLTPPNSQQQLPNIVEKFYPRRYTDGLQAMEIKVIERKIQEKWLALRMRTMQDCVRIYLTVARKWPYFGAKLFSAKARFCGLGQVWLAVQEDFIAILEYATLMPITSHDYKQVVTFGGYMEDFMLVVTVTKDAMNMSATEGVLSASLSKMSQSSKTERRLFAMSKHKVHEVTMLMSAYINSKSQHKNMLHTRLNSPTKTHVFPHSLTPAKANANMEV